MNKYAITLVLILTASTSAMAQSVNMNSMILATQLGDIIASEGFCGLSYNQDAISAFIDKKVAPSDMSFPSTLKMMIDGAKYGQASMSKSAKTAHCRQTRRVARSYGFIQ